MTGALWSGWKGRQNMATNDALITREELDTARERLKNWLEDSRSTAAYLASVAHVDRKMLYNWLGYQRQTMTPLQIEKLARAAGMSTKELISPLGPKDYR